MTQCKNIILAGDINIAINPEKIDKCGEYYHNITAYCGLLPAHSYITRDETGTCLDHIFLKTKLSSKTMVIQSTVTDHKAILLCLENKPVRNYSVINASKINSKSLAQDLVNVDVTPIFNSNDPESSMALLTNAIQTLIEKNTETITLPNRKKNIKPWMTTGLLRCSRNQDSLHKKHKRDPDNMILKQTYTRYRNFCNTLQRRVKLSYDKQQIDKLAKIARNFGKPLKLSPIQEPQNLNLRNF